MPSSSAVQPQSAGASQGVARDLAPLALRGVGLPNGSVGDVWLSGGGIEGVEPPTRIPSGDERSLDLSGYVLLPSFVEAHVHLDKAFTADVVENPAGDLIGAITAWRAARPALGVEEIVERARSAALRYLQNGTTAIRTHVDTGEGIGLRALAALLEVRSELADVLDLQIVALCSTPVTGLAGRENRAFLRAALEAGADGVGGAAFLDDIPPAALAFFVSLAEEFGAFLDMHVDETLDRDVFTLPALAALVADGFSRPVTASHCVSLGVQNESTQRRVAEALAAQRIGVVTLPQTNLSLQGRNQPVSTPRGLTAIRPLIDAGVAVAAGAGNAEDPFNPVGHADALEVAALLVAAGHLTPAEALRLVTTGGRDVLGLQPVEIAPGSPADLVAVRATNRRTAIADAPADRIVLRGGEIVAWTRVESNVSHHLDGGARPGTTDNVVTFGSVPVESGHRTVESRADWEVRTMKLEASSVYPVPVDAVIASARRQVGDRRQVRGDGSSRRRDPGIRRGRRHDSDRVVADRRCRAAGIREEGTEADEHDDPDRRLASRRRRVLVRQVLGRREGLAGAHLRHDARRTRRRGYASTTSRSTSRSRSRSSAASLRTGSDGTTCSARSTPSLRSTRAGSGPEELSSGVRAAPAPRSTSVAGPRGHPSPAARRWGAPGRGT